MRHPAHCSYALLLSAAVLLSGCVSIEQAAPPVATLPGTKSPARLEKGRDIYITRCAKCHAVEPVRKYSRAKWNDILQEMSEEAKLSPTEAAEVHDYVFAVLNRGRSS